MTNSSQNPEPQKQNGNQRSDRSGLLAIILIVIMGLLLIFGFEFLADWLGRLFGM